MDEFATTTQLLADERRNIESLVHSLAVLSTSGLNLISVHGARLDQDITELTRTLQAVSVHLDNLDQILIATPLLAAGPQFDGKRGLAAAVDPTLHRIDLRDEVSPTVAQAFAALNLPAPGAIVCLPVDVTCTPTPGGGTIVSPLSAASPAAAAAATGSPTALATSPGAINAAPVSAAVVPGAVTTPIDDIVRLFGTAGTPDLSLAAPSAPSKHPSGPFSWLRRLARTASGVAG
jgi:hypothetical protein